MYHEQGCMNWVSGFLVRLLRFSIYVPAARFVYVVIVYVIERCVFVVHHGRVCLHRPGDIAQTMMLTVQHCNPLRAVLSILAGCSGSTVYRNLQCKAGAESVRQSCLTHQTVRAARDNDDADSTVSWRFMEHITSTNSSTPM